MKKQLVIIGITLVLIAVAFTGCIENPKTGDTRLLNTEFIGGTYNASILYLERYFDDEGKWFNYTDIKYTKNGMDHQGFYLPSMKENLDWIKTNTSENCTILCWWDYGMMIEGYAERNVVAKFGSLATTDFIAMFGMLDEEGKRKFIEEHEWSSNETIQELAMVLTATNISSDEVKDIIQKYNVNYILTTRYDKDIARIFFNVAGKNADEYLIDKMPNEKGNETLVFKMWNVNPQVYGLQLYYSNNVADVHSDVRIFKVVI